MTELTSKVFCYVVFPLFIAMKSNFDSAIVLHESLCSGGSVVAYKGPYDEVTTSLEITDLLGLRF